LEQPASASPAITASAVAHRGIADRGIAAFQRIIRVVAPLFITQLPSGLMSIDSVENITS
jgi:hypothetical protein